MVQVEIVVSEDGETVEMHVIGAHGPDCLKATKELEDAIGRVQNRIKKPEFNEVVPNSGPFQRQRPKVYA